MKLSSLVLLMTLSLSALAQTANSQAKQLEYVAQKSASIVREIQEKSSHPDLLDSTTVSEFVRNSFLKDGYSISHEEATSCISYEMRKDDDRYATAYEVLLDGYAAECFVKNLKSN